MISASERCWLKALDLAFMVSVFLLINYKLNFRLAYRWGFGVHFLCGRNEFVDVLTWFFSVRFEIKLLLTGKFRTALF